MSSSVFFRFKSQKEPSRITFDGTGITVFELKRDIIAANRLGDGSDFELVIGAEDTNEEYDDDTTIIPRSTTVIAKRLPATKAGRGGAARYVSGKMPQNAKNSHRVETSSSKPVAQLKTTNGAQQMSDTSGGQTEEEKIAAMFQNSKNQWDVQQQEMANAIPVFRGGPNKGKNVNVPDHPPPAGYICYRCGEKGHFIQACPTNDDPNFDGRPRVKRTTGIPRSFLKTVEKPSALANDGTVDDTKQPSGVMVNAEGEWVVAEPDQASWDQYQAKAKVSAAAQQAAVLDSKELQEKGLECSIDKRLFVEPTKTPCCHTTYCNECITNALLESGLTCPSCSTEDVVLDHLVPDEEIAFKVRSYRQEKGPQDTIKDGPNSPISKAESDNERQPTKSGSPSKDDARPKHERKSQSPKAERSSPDKTSSKATISVQGQSSQQGKKRPAETDLNNDRTPPGPAAAAMGRQPPADGKSQSNQQSVVAPSMPGFPQIPFTNGNYMMGQGMNAMAYPNVNAMTAFPGMNMNTGIYNPALMGNNMFMNPDVNWNMWGQAYPQQQMGISGSAYQNGMYATTGYNTQNMQVPTSNGYSGVNGAVTKGHNYGSFPNQQRNHFQGSNDEDSAYFRKPVNPHRHQGRRNMNRPADYREI